MYKYKKAYPTSIKINQSTQGEPIEKKMARITQNKEPIKDGAPIIYTERKDGVLPEHDIRTDRMEIALEALDKVSKAKLARREEKLNPPKTDEGITPKPTDLNKPGDKKNEGAA